MYKAIMTIGDYKEGDTVPDELATVWDKMYDISPVENIGKKGESTSGEPKENLGSGMEDDYLNRNKHVVKKNLESDNLTEGTLQKLLRIEEDNKNRTSILNVIKSKIGELQNE